MRKFTFVLPALVALALCVWVEPAFAGEASVDIGDVVKNLLGGIFRGADTAIIVLGVLSVAVNQLSQVWAWAADSKMAKIDRLIEGAISFAYLLKGQKWKKEQGGKLTLEQGQDLAGTALNALKRTAAAKGINLDSRLGDDNEKRSRIQNVFDRLRNRAKSEKGVPDVPEDSTAAA